MTQSVDWPEAFPRTEPRERERCPNGFRVSVEQAFDNILKELEKWDGVTDVQLEFGAESQIRNPNRPYANSSFDDPSVLVYFTKDGEQMAAGCDKWDNTRDNAQDLYYYLHETRMQEQRGSVTAESEYKKLRLPSGNGQTFQQKQPHEILEIQKDASPGVIEAAFREKVKETHPDRGGSSKEYMRVIDAKKTMMQEVRQ